MMSGESEKVCNGLVNDSCKDSASKSNDDGVCEENNMLQNMSTADNTVSVCANCGKEGDDVNNICNKCKKAKYCNAVCKKVHKKKHKKDCEEFVRLAAEKHEEELRLAAEKHDEELLKQPPPEEDCPICFLLLPTLSTGRRYQSCCGKVICSGCCYAPVYDNQGNEVNNQKCPYCRTPFPYAHKEGAERIKKRVKANDPIAIYNTGNYYRDGRNGYPQDDKKAIELWHRAGKLGDIESFLNIGSAYKFGRGIEVDLKKANYYWELGAMKGDVSARHNLGVNEEIAGNMDRALKHHMIAVRSGFAKSLGEIQEYYLNGHATKNDYTKTLHSYQTYLGEIKSPQRDKAAAFGEEFRYY